MVKHCLGLFHGPLVVAAVEGERETGGGGGSAGDPPSIVVLICVASVSKLLVEFKKRI